jgi:hypothetical protein
VTYYDYDKSCDFSELLGKTLTSVENVGDEIIFKTDQGAEYRQYHPQSCCESVSVEDICGDLSDLIGMPILLAEAEESEKRPEGPVEDPDDYRDRTWTFYKLSTLKGSVTIRWYGESNGYYSTSVDFVQVK